MLRSAVIGLGDIGPVHVKAIKGLPGAQLAAVCDIDQALRPQDTKLPFFTDYREMLEAIHPDCVHICLPHYLHYPAALDAAPGRLPCTHRKAPGDEHRGSEKIHGTGIHIPSQGWGLLSKQG